MSVIHLKEIFQIEIEHALEDKKFTFDVPIGDQSCFIEYTPSKEHLEIQTQFTTQKEITTFEQVKTSLNKEVIENTLKMRGGLDKLLDHIQYTLGQEITNRNMLGIQEALIAIDCGVWEQIEPIIELKITQTMGPPKLDEESAGIIQEYLGNNEEPFIALRHLQRAKEETTPRYMIIEAAIAAELAIKEFLSRKYPHLKGLLVELPSPPINKLYGSILETYHGKKYPSINQLQKIATHRNDFVHKPESTELSFESATKLVMEVEKAIKFLLKELYPNHPWALFVLV